MTGDPFLQVHQSKKPMRESRVAKVQQMAESRCVNTEYEKRKPSIVTKDRLEALEELKAKASSAWLAAKDL